MTGESFLVVFELDEGEAGVEVNAGEYILQAARDAGLELPSMCEQGWCTTCAVEIVEGEIDQSDSRRYYEDDRRAGFGLICTGKPRSALRLRPGASRNMRRFRRSRGLPVPRATGL
ncbi:MAG: 2Fe-2S iron-sulfur cluster binding domain-containing protein [Actinomycetota bacterium]|nr:2Fe-2S iron-sulfur cluster binding domain-containing protein [Actinomycetota bacterium]